MAIITVGKVPAISGPLAVLIPWKTHYSRAHVAMGIGTEGTELLGTTSSSTQTDVTQKESIGTLLLDERTKTRPS